MIARTIIGFTTVFSYVGLVRNRMPPKPVRRCASSKALTTSQL